MTTAADVRASQVADRRTTPRDTALHSILVVDDEEAIRGLLAAILGGEGYQVAVAANGQEALQHLKGHPVDLLIADVKLPDMDGITLIRRAFESDAKLLAIAITGYGSVDLAVNAMKAGASDFLAKPFSPELVSLTVKRLADLRRLRQENAVLKHSLVRSGSVRLHAVALADFADGGRVEGPDGLTEFERGLAEGERRIVQREGAARERERALLTALAQRLEEAWATLHLSVEEDVNALAFAIAAKVLRQAVEEKRDLVLEQVRVALAHIHDSGVVQIRVHPSDVPILESARDCLVKSCERPVTFVLAGDPNVSPGGCLVRTGSRLVDATLEAQLVRLGEAIRQRERREIH